MDDASKKMSIASYNFIKNYAIFSLAGVWERFDYSGISRLKFIKSVNRERASMRVNGLVDGTEFSLLCARCNEIEDKIGAVTFDDDVEFMNDLAKFLTYSEERQSEISNRRIKQWFDYYEATIGPCVRRRNIKFDWIRT